jgi:hypothetical protein
LTVPGPPAIGGREQVRAEKVAVVAIDEHKVSYAAARVLAGICAPAR